MSVPAFANGGMNVTGLRLVDLDNRVVKSYVQGWSLVNRSGTVLAGASNNNKIIEVCTTSGMAVIITRECGVVMRSVASVCLSVCPVHALTKTRPRNFIFGVRVQKI